MVITNQKDLRKAFWDSHPTLHSYSGYHQNDYDAGTRVAWVDWIDGLCRDGTISETLAGRATL